MGGIARGLLPLAAVLALAGCGAGRPAPAQRPLIGRGRQTVRLGAAASPVLGQRLVATPGVWSGNPTRFTYQWEDCDATGSGCVAIAGATGTSYVVQASDECGTLETIAVAWNNQGSASQASAPTGQVLPCGGMSGTGLRVSAQAAQCPTSTAQTCAELIDSSGNVVHMHGADLSGTEYACVNGGGFGIFSGAQNTQADINAMLAWHINFVRIQLNEDCWLGINTSGLNSSYVDTSAGVGPYASAIETFVSLLHSNGIYTEIVDMWNAPGTEVATGQSGQQPGLGSAYFGPDEDHSPAMWASMAQAFANDADTILSPAGEENVSMGCQMSGCSNQGIASSNVDGLGSGSFNGETGFFYTVAGLSQAVSVMRSNGFKGPIALECAHFGGTCDCSQPGTSCAGGVTAGATWAADKPTDSLSTSQIVAEIHNYGNGDAAAGPSFYDAQYAPVVNGGYPMFEGELGEGASSNCGDTYIPEATSWADAYGIGYMNWTWTAGTGDCTAMISDYTSGASEQPPSAATFTANTTNQSTSIASASSITGLVVGQVLAGSGLPAGDTIVSISGTTLTMSLESTATATGVSLTAEQGNWGWVKAHDQTFVNAAPQTNISNGQPTYANTGALNPANATDGTYDSSNSGGCGCDQGASHVYQCNHTPSAGSPCFVDVNVSATIGTNLKAIVAFYNPSVWEPTNGASIYNTPGSYTIDACSSSCTGTPPSTGWTNLQTVTGSNVSSNVSPVLTLPAGTKWIRFQVTAPSPDNPAGNQDDELKLDVLAYQPPSSNPTAPSDTWLALGDSLTQYSMTPQEPSNFMQKLNALAPSYYPAMMDNGIGSWSSENEVACVGCSSGTSYVQDVVNWWKGHYVAVDYGGLSEACNGHMTDTAQIIAQLTYAGFQPAMWYSPLWTSALSTANNTNESDIIALNDGPPVASGTCDGDGKTFLFMRYPTLLAGPDEWNFFTQGNTWSTAGSTWSPSTPLSSYPAGCNETSLFNCVEDSTNVHPGHPVGENDARLLWTQAALFNAHGG